MNFVKKCNFIGSLFGMNWYAYTKDDPVNNTDPTGLYNCRDAKACEAAQNLAIEKITQTMSTLKDMQGKLSSGDKLNKEEQKVSDRLEKNLGSSDAKAIDGLLAAGKSMLGVLKGNAPVEFGPSSGKSYATTPAYGGVILRPMFFSSSPKHQASTVAHESAHLGLCIRDPYVKIGP